MTAIAMLENPPSLAESPSDPVTIVLDFDDFAAEMGLSNGNGDEFSGETTEFGVGPNSNAHENTGILSDSVTPSPATLPAPTRLPDDLGATIHTATPENAPAIALEGVGTTDGSSGETGAVLATIGDTPATPAAGQTSPPLVDEQGAAGAATGAVNSLPLVEQGKVTWTPPAQNDAEIRAKYQKIWDLESQIRDQEKSVLEQHVAVAHLDKKVKTARKDLKEATEDLIKLQGELIEANEDLDEAREAADREWFAMRRAATPAAGQNTNPLPLVENRTEATPDASGFVAGVVPGYEILGVSTDETTSVASSTAKKIRRFIPEDPAISTDLWVLKSKQFGGGATNAQIEKLNGEDVRTIANLEEYIRNGLLVPGRVKGLGQAAVDKISDALMAWRLCNPVPVECEVEDVEEPAAGPDVIANEHKNEPSTGSVTECEPSLQKTLENETENAKKPDKTVRDQPNNATTPVPPAAGILSVNPHFDIDTQIKAAYTAGCEAALAEKPVGSNPHGKGTQLWSSWDAGWQETYSA